MRQLWNVWSPGSRNIHGDYRIHAFEETIDGKWGEKTLCGITMGKYWQTGMVKIPQETMPGCHRCQKAIKSLTPNPKPSTEKKEI